MSLSLPRISQHRKLSLQTFIESRRRMQLDVTACFDAATQSFSLLILYLLPLPNTSWTKLWVLNMLNDVQITSCQLQVVMALYTKPPSVETMSPKPKYFISQMASSPCSASELTLTAMEKGGGWKAGRPPSIFPVRLNTQSSGFVLQSWPSGSIIMAITRQTITTMAFLAVQMNQMPLSRRARPRPGSLLVSLCIRPASTPSLMGLNQPVLFKAWKWEMNVLGKLRYLEFRNSKLMFYHVKSIFNSWTWIFRDQIIQELFHHPTSRGHSPLNIFYN